MQTVALIFLSALLSASSAQPLDSTTHLTLPLPWHPPPPPPPPNTDLRLKPKPKHKPRMLMPDSPQPSPPSTWRLGTALPVSYRVAIAIDAFVLLITILSLVLLGVYIRRQYNKRKSSLLHGKEEDEFDDEESLGGKDGLDGEKDEEVSRDGGREGERERKKKGHVRWTSSVVGMGVFKGRGDEGKVRLGEEGERGWGCDARVGGPYEVQGGARKTEVSVRVAAGDDGFRGI